jgi:hypothetical protein
VVDLREEEPPLRDDAEMMTDGGQSAPGTERFTHADLDCKIVHTDMGHWCGYVQIPDDLSPVRWTTEYDSKHDEILDAEVDVWGGITYGPDDDGWVGFDDAHSPSLGDHREFDMLKDTVKNETQRLADQIRSLRTETDQGEGRAMSEQSTGETEHYEVVPRLLRRRRRDRVITQRRIRCPFSSASSRLSTDLRVVWRRKSSLYGLDPSNQTHSSYLSYLSHPLYPFQ